MREYIDVVPSNGSGTASYKDGNPIVNFIIGAQDQEGDVSLLDDHRRAAPATRLMGVCPSYYLRLA